METLGIIVADYPPFLGGISRYTGDVVLFLARNRPVRVYCLADTPPPAWDRHPHCGCISRNELEQQPESVASRLMQDGVKHVIINHIDLVGPRTLLAFRKAGFSCSVFIYGADINFRRSLRGHARMYATAALMKYRIVISKGTRALFHRRLPGLATRMVLPGIDMRGNEVSPARPGDGIIAVGRFVRRKGFDTLLDAVARLAESGLRPRLTLAGDGPDKMWLAERSRELGLEAQMRIVSGLSDAQIREELRSHRVFCLLPRSLGSGDVEGFGIVFLEAAREGIPVVAGRSGGVPDAVADGKNGFLVDPNNPADAAARLRELLTNDDLWKRQSREGIAWCQTFAWSARNPEREFAFLDHAS